MNAQKEMEDMMSNCRCCGHNLNDMLGAGIEVYFSPIILGYWCDNCHLIVASEILDILSSKVDRNQRKLEVK